MLGVKRINELILRNASLLEEAAKSADFYFTVVGNDATQRAATHDDVAAALAGNYKTEAFQYPDNFSAGNDR